MPLRTESHRSILHSGVWKRTHLELKSRGCRFALDDFGVGFGDANTTDRLVVEAIVGIARGMGKKTVAEFVTDRDMTDRLRRSDIDYARGFHMGVPRPILETVAPVPPWIERRAAVQSRTGRGTHQRIQWKA